MGEALNLLNALAVVGLVSFMIVAAFGDWLTHRIPNQLTYTFGILAMLISITRMFLTTSSAPQLLPLPTAALFGGLVCFLPTFVCWRYKGMGGGDVKVATVIGLFLGADLGIAVLTGCHLLAATYCVGIAIQQASAFWNTKSREGGKPLHSVVSLRLPMAGFYALATFSILCWSYLK